jgi:hypothetical protein
MAKLGMILASSLLAFRRFTDQTRAEASVSVPARCKDGRFGSTPALEAMCVHAFPDIKHYVHTSPKENLPN